MNCTTEATGISSFFVCVPSTLKNRSHLFSVPFTSVLLTSLAHPLWDALRRPRPRLKYAGEILATQI